MSLCTLSSSNRTFRRTNGTTFAMAPPYCNLIPWTVNCLSGVTLRTSPYTGRPVDINHGNILQSRPDRWGSDALRLDALAPGVFGVASPFSSLPTLCSPVDARPHPHY